MKSHLHLIDYALSKGCFMSVACHDGFKRAITLTHSTIRSEIVRAVTACHKSTLFISSAEKEWMGTALIVNDTTLEPDEFIADYTATVFMGQWWVAYTQIQQKTKNPSPVTVGKGQHHSLGDQTKMNTQTLTKTKDHYTFFEDPGHGWLEVPRRELEELGIETEISSYSYQKGDCAYLEEDCDLTRYIHARFPDMDRDTIRAWFDNHTTTKRSGAPRGMACYRSMQEVA